MHTLRQNRLTLIEAFRTFFRSVPESEIEKIAYQSVPEWDSIGHVQLIMRIEEAFGLEIPIADAARLTTFQSILRYVEKDPIEFAEPSKNEVRRGLNGVLLDETLVSDINGEEGKLLYRGYPVEAVLADFTVHEANALLLTGEVPNEKSLDHQESSLRNGFQLEPFEFALLKMLSTESPEDLLIAILSLKQNRERGLYSIECAYHLQGKMLAILAQVARMKRGDRDLESPHPHERVFDSFYRQLIGRVPSPLERATLETTFVLQAEHGCNASTLALRTAIGAGADLPSAIVAAISTFRGDLHGGALIRALEMIRAISAEEKVASEVAYRLENRIPVYGFGHRLYKTTDPRARVFKSIARDVSTSDVARQHFKIAEELEVQMDRLGRHGLKVNVDLFGGLALAAVSVPETLVLSTFICHRAIGWLAHALEQKANNILIRPQLKYVGAILEPFT